MIGTFMPTRYCAVSMDVVADLDATYVKAHIRTDTGKNITLICEGARIPAIRRRIESLQHAFPGMTAWPSIAGLAALQDRREPAPTASPPPAPTAA